VCKLWGRTKNDPYQKTTHDSSFFATQTMHVKALSSHPQLPADKQRVPVKEVRWSYADEDYKPKSYTADVVKKNVAPHGGAWADPDDIDAETVRARPCYDMHGNTPEEQHYDPTTGYPRNPVGRTGLEGRFLLGKWGPNEAADSLVFRVLDHDDGTRELQFVAIKRKDTGEPAIPGGMVEGGETVAVTFLREFLEEAASWLSQNDTESSASVLSALEEMFDNPLCEVYRGYVDDPRNTDNAWMQTTARLFVLPQHISDLPLKAGDDAGDVYWMSVDPASPPPKMYANHGDIVHAAAARLESHLVAGSDFSTLFSYFGVALAAFFVVCASYLLGRD